MEPELFWDLEPEPKLWSKLGPELNFKGSKGRGGSGFSIVSWWDLARKSSVGKSVQQIFSVCFIFPFFLFMSGKFTYKVKFFPKRRFRSLKCLK